MESVLEELGTLNISRLRLGIETRIDKKIPLDAFVLSPFGDKEMDLFKKQIQEGIDLLENSLAI